MNQNKIYLHATQQLIESVIIIFDNCVRDKEISLQELIDSYNEYRNIKINLDWFKSSVDTIKDSLDKLELNNESRN